MKCGARVALGVAGGYLLGRTKKMKFALMLAGMAAGRRAGGPGELLKTGTKLLGSSPELARLTDEVRGRLLEAGKSAAVAVAARQVESLTDRVGRRVESLGDLGAGRRKSEEPSQDEDAQDEDGRYEDSQDEAPADEGTADEAPADQGTADEGAADEAPAEESRDDEEEPAPRTPARARAANSGRSGGTATAGVRRAAGGAGKAAGRTAGTAGKAVTGRRTSRSPRTRRTDGDG